ncbi:TraB/GumN family protein [Alteriqipengyuania lutimaris]|uniref:TraB/GumN family protein n=1 Tax=Alteriqipengyuania lutimaris TaxID=1538146 RepID=A0A395LLU7_9SPHN|nr:TraB/GumN family protein [Alteriqipengyuania lutimaris]MBB3032942.1 hypothetical protein [Alteriqipengyuania lutimaris]RDS77978.1 TraB/GumN family protein [Alteriqipengyuania lutimaris]
MTISAKPLLTGIATVALAIGSGACAQTQATPTPVASTQVPAGTMEMGGPALWRIADEDTTIYVFGTVHVLPDDVEWYTGPVKTALDESDTLVTEIDMTPEAMTEVPALVQQIAMLPEGTTVRSLMDDEERATYEATLNDLGIPVNALDQLDPWFAALQLSNAAYALGGFDQKNGTETVLERTIGERMGRDALETVESQFAIFDELPQDAQVDYLIQTAEQIDEITPFLQKIVAEWSEGDVEQLGELMNEAMEADPVLAERMLYARNANWAVWIDERLDSPGTIFMAVGAGHMAGNQKLQDKLAERGIEMTRVQ